MAKKIVDEFNNLFGTIARNIGNRFIHLTPVYKKGDKLQTNSTPFWYM